MNFNGILTKAAKFVWVTAPNNYTGAAATTEYISMKAYEKVLFIVQTGAWAAGTAAVTINQATNVSAGSAKALAFTKMYTNDGAPTTDTLTETTVAANTFNLDTANSLYLIEVNNAMLDVDNGFDCVSLAIASPGVNDDYYSVVAIAYGGRFEELTGISAITN